MSKKQLVTIEYPVRCSPAILWEFISSAAGLQEWFADRVDVREGIFSFSWNGGLPERAKVVEYQDDYFIRFRCDYMSEDEYFEFRIEMTEISNQTVLVVKDFVDKNDIKDQTQLWNYQIKELFHRLGA